MTNHDNIGINEFLQTFTTHIYRTFATDTPNPHILGPKAEERKDKNIRCTSPLKDEVNKP